MNATLLDKSAPSNMKIRYFRLFLMNYQYTHNYLKMNFPEKKASSSPFEPPKLSSLGFPISSINSSTFSSINTFCSLTR